MAIDLSKLKPGDKVFVVAPDGSRKRIPDYPVPAKSDEALIEVTLWGSYSDTTLALISPPEGYSCWDMSLEGIKRRIGDKFPDKAYTDAGFVPNKTPLWEIPIENIRKVSSSAPVVSASHDPGGCACDNCKEFSPYAAANVGDKFVCYQCRSDPFRYRF